MIRAIIVLALAACSTAQPIPEEPRSEQQDFYAPNVFERCKPKCEAKGLRVVEAWENAHSYRCHCIPWDA